MELLAKPGNIIGKLGVMDLWGCLISLKLHNYHFECVLREGFGMLYTRSFASKWCDYVPCSCLRLD